MALQKVEPDDDNDGDEDSDSGSSVRRLPWMSQVEEQLMGKVHVTVMRCGSVGSFAALCICLSPLDITARLSGCSD